MERGEIEFYTDAVVMYRRRVLGQHFSIGYFKQPFYFETYELNVFGQKQHSEKYLIIYILTLGFGGEIARDE